MKKYNYILIGLLLIINSSCVSNALNKQLKEIGAYKNSSEIIFLSNGEKNVAFIGMHHVGRQEFYEHVAKKIDSLQKQDYIVFYESTREDKNTDSDTKDITKRKYRQLFGFAPLKYIDTTNNTFLGKYELPEKHKLINQPDYEDLNVDLTKALRADISFSVLLREFENRYGEIKLDSCHLNTPLDYKNFTCDRIDEDLQKKFFEEIIMDYRNQNLAKKINNSKHNKIVVIYGRFHYKGMLEELKLINENWKQTRD